MAIDSYSGQQVSGVLVVELSSASKFVRTSAVVATVALIGPLRYAGIIFRTVIFVRALPSTAFEPTELTAEAYF